MLRGVFIAVFCLLFIAPVEASNLKLSKKAKSAVEAGEGSLKQNAQYVAFYTFNDPTMSYALMETWAVNGTEFPIAKYQEKVNPSKFPVFIRGTALEQVHKEREVVSYCLRDEPCGKYLASTTVELLKMPREVISMAYESKTKIDSKLLKEQLTGKIVMTREEAIKKLQKKVETTAPQAQQVGVQEFVYNKHTGETISLVIPAQGRLEVTKEKDGVSETLATALSVGDKMLVTLPNGDKVESTLLKPTVFGFMLLVDGKMISYTNGQLKTIELPLGYGFAPRQPVDIHGTGYAIIERQVENELAESIKDLGNIFGVGKAYDYALLNLATGQYHLFAIENNTKNVSVKYNCTKVNSLVNSCKNMDTYESLTKADGRKNYRHYYNAIHWFTTSGSAYALAKEGTKITVTNLQTGERRVAFSRRLGIAWHEYVKNDDGSTGIDAGMGFKSESIPNVVEAFNDLKPYKSKQQVAYMD